MSTYYCYLRLGLPKWAGASTYMVVKNGTKIIKLSLVDIFWSSSCLNDHLEIDIQRGLKAPIPLQELKRGAQTASKPSS